MEKIPSRQPNWFSLFSCRWPLTIVAIAAGNEVDVVLARLGKEGGVHLLNVKAAM